MKTPPQIRKRVHELQQRISEKEAEKDRDRLKHRGLTARYLDLDRKERLQRILEELSSLTHLSEGVP